MLTRVDPILLGMQVHTANIRWLTTEVGHQLEVTILFTRKYMSPDSPVTILKS